MFQRNLLFNEIQALQINSELEFEVKDYFAAADALIPSVFKQAGLKTTSVINNKTPALIQTALTRSVALSSFVAVRVSHSPLSKIFFHYGSVDEFTHKYKKLNNIAVPFGSPEDKKLRNIRGFYHRKTDSIHLSPTVNLGHALLFSITRLSSPAFGNFFGYRVSEGVGLHFTNLVLREQGLEPLKPENTQELHCGEDLGGVVGVEMLGKAYFQNHLDLVKHLQNKLSIKPVEIKELAGDALFKSKLLRTARYAAHRAENMVGVGRTDARSVRLWMRSAVAGAHEAHIMGGAGGAKSVKFEIPALNNRDNTFAVNYPNSSADPPLDPLTKYKYRITRTSDRALVGEGSFETSPVSDANTPEKVCIALMSCHQPFSERGSLDPLSARMLRLLPYILKENNVKFVIPCGDQIYADEPGIFSLFGNSYLIRQVVPGKTDIMKCSSDEVRRLYDMRYRTLWSMKQIREMYANYPCYPIMDDHEIKDSWGAQPEHSQPKYSNIMKGALSAFFDYQASGVLPQMPRGSFHYSFSYGNIGVFVMDLRSQRSFNSNSQIYSAQQFGDLNQFLEKNKDKKVLLIVSSVPVFFVPEGLADVGGIVKPTTFNDHWSHPKNIPARNALLQLLYNHRAANPNQLVAIVSGDVHIAHASAIHVQGLAQPWLYEFTSSPITAWEKGKIKTQVRIAPRLLTTSSSNFDFPCGKLGEFCSGRISRLSGVKGASQNPYVDMNIGIIEIRRSGAFSKIKFKLIGASPESEKERPVTYFESDWLE